MPASNSDIKYRGGSDGAPANNSDPYGGAIETGIDLNENTPGILLQTIPRPSGADADYYGAGYRENTHASSDWTDAAYTLRNGALLPSGSGVASVVSSSASDVGTMRVTGKVGGAWTQEDIVLNGTTTVFGTEIWDTGEVWRWEYINGGSPAFPTGNVTCAVDDEVVSVMYGGTYPNNQNTAEWEIAVATAVDSAVGGTNRLTAPTGVGAFSRAVKWSGAGAVDQSLPIPGGGDLIHGHYCGYAVHFIGKDDIPAPLSGYVFPDVNLPGVPT